jgi:heme oxygenase (mycobilin-producing)
MFIALSRFIVANHLAPEVKEAFKSRPHMVEDAAGFVRMEVISPLDNPDEVWLLTYWRDADSYQDWHRSHQYHQAHKGIPKGLKLIPGSAAIRLFEHVCS